MRKLFIPTVIFGLVFTACDEDFTTIGADIVGDGHYDFNSYSVQNISAYSRATGAVQSNGLPLNALGNFEDVFFGSTTAHFVTQLELETVKPDFGISPEIQSIDSVYLYIPYFSTKTATATGNQPNTYRLDSIQGNRDIAFDLAVYESGYFLRNYDHNNPSEAQRYFSDEKNLIENTLVGAKLNNASNISENTNFTFSNSEIIFYKKNRNGQYLDKNDEVTTNPDDYVVKQRLAPGMWINLDKPFFSNKIISANSSNLINNTNFREYFKGLYFKTTASQSAALAQLDFSKGYIAVQYHSKDNLTANSTRKELKIKLKGNTINFFDNAFSADYQSGLTAAANNDEKLYLKGGNGSVVFLELFGADADNNGIADELEELRSKNMMINDAVLTFYVSAETQTNARRIYIYDVENNKIIADYNVDTTTSSNTKNNKYVVGGFLSENSENGAKKYSIKLTHYIKNLLDSKELSSTAKLGITVTESVNITAMAKVKNQTLLGYETLPLSSVLNPLGTVLYGSNTAPEDADKKIKLEIHYTKTK